MNSHQVLSDEYLYSKANGKFTRECSFFFFVVKQNKKKTFMCTKAETFNICELIILQRQNYGESWKSWWCICLINKLNPSSWEEKLMFSSLPITQKEELMPFKIWYLSEIKITEYVSVISIVPKKLSVALQNNINIAEFLKDSHYWTHFRSMA